MIKRAEIIRELKKAIDFYNELGFKHMPVKKEIIYSLISNAASNKGQGVVNCTQEEVLEKTETYISNKGAALKNLRSDIGDCQRCKLSKNRKNIVFGEGDADADLMLVGEGPGRDEDIQARPFVGDAGKLLTNLIVKLGLRRDDVYIANIVKCRPPNNRNPEEDEIATCRPFLERQIEIIKPKVIVCLGKIAAQSLLGSKELISKLRGNFFTYNNITVMPTYHPSYLLRNPRDKWLTWEDMQKVLEKLKE
jgi:DNA polymerase